MSLSASCESVSQKRTLSSLLGELTARSRRPYSLIIGSEGALCTLKMCSVSPVNAEYSWPCGKEAEAGGLRAAPRGDHPAVGAAAEPAQPLSGSRGEEKDTHEHNPTTKKTERNTCHHWKDIYHQLFHMFFLFIIHLSLFCRIHHWRTFFLGEESRSHQSLRTSHVPLQGHC